MKKVKNILLFSSVFLYLIYYFLEIYTIFPDTSSDSLASNRYLFNTISVNILEFILLVSFPIVLICLNFKGKSSKIFSIMACISGVINLLPDLTDIYGMGLALASTSSPFRNLLFYMVCLFDYYFLSIRLISILASVLVITCGIIFLLNNNKRLD